MKQPPCCLQGSAEAWAGLAILFSLARMAWPCGLGQRQDGRTAGRQDSRTAGWQDAGAAWEAQEGLSSGAVLTDPEAVLGELRPHMEIGITWLLFSNPDIHSSQPPTLPPHPPRCVQDGRVLSASFLHHPLPRHGWGSPAARGLARKEATNPPPSAFVGNAL